MPPTGVFFWEKSMKKITVVNQFDIYFAPEDHKSLLEAMEEQGVRISNMCHDGFCNQCRCEITEGEVEYFQDIILSEPEKYILPCSCIPKTDLTVIPD